MADFLLSVGADVGLSYKQMKEDITNLISKINESPPKIKVEFDIDKSTSEALRSQIAAISKINSNNSSTSLIDANTAAIAKNTSAKDASAVASAKSADAEVKDAIATNANSASKKKLSTAEKSAYTAIIRGEKALRDYSAAARSSNAESRAAYNEIVDGVQRVKDAVNEFYNSSSSAHRDAKKLNEVVAESNSALKKHESMLKANNDATKTFSERIGGLAQKFTTWFSITSVVMTAYRLIRNMVSSVVELDTAMTELKKVTDETDITYEKFLVNASNRAKQLGAVLSDTVTATADFARLGYSIEDAEKLADAAVIYKNVGDGIADISDASESIIATMQAFGISADEAMNIVDKFNEVGNNYAISSKGVGEALLRSAAAMKAAGNTLDETIALATAANTVVQDPEKVGTTLKTVSMYLRAAKTEAEEAGESTDGMASSVSKLRDELLSLTGNKVDIQIDKDNFKSTYQILQELSGVWDKLTDITKANILEKIGGKRNSNIVAALLENFSIAQKALETSADSTGSALAENEKYLDSIQGKISIMKASFESLSGNLVDSDLIKFFVNTGTWFLDFFNGIAKVMGALGGLKTTLLAVASVLLIVKSGFIAYGVELVAVSSLNKVIKFFTNLKSGLLNITHAIPAAIAAWKSYAAGTAAANEVLQASIPVIGLVLAALTALIGGLSLYSQKSNEARQAALDIADAYREQQSEMASMKETINEISERYEKLSKGVDSFGNNISLSTEQYEEYKDIVNQIADMFPTMIQGYNDEGLAILSCKGNVDELTRAYNNLAIAQNNKVLGESSTLFDDLKRKFDEFDKKTIGGFNYTTEVHEALKQILNSTDIDSAIDKYASAGSDIQYRIIQAFKDAGLKHNAWEESGHDFISRAIRENKIIVESVVSNFDSKMYAATQGMQSVVSAYISNAFLGSYSDISSASQTLISNIISGFDSDFYSQFRNKSLNELYDYLNNLMETFRNLSSDDTKTLTATLNLKTSYNNGECTIEEYINAINKAKKVIGKLDEDAGKRLNISLGIDDNDIEKRYENVLNKVGNKNKEWLNDLNSEDFDLVYKISVDNDTAKWTLDDWNQKLKESREELNTFSLSDLSKSLSELKSAYDVLKTAQSEMVNGGLSDSTIKSLSDITSDYIDYLYEENGVIKLNTDAWKELSNAAMESSISYLEKDIDTLESERLEIEKHIESLNNATVVSDSFVGQLEKGVYTESEFANAVSDANNRLSENAEKIKENQNLLSLYSASYDKIVGFSDAYSSALSGFSDVKSLIDSVSGSLTTVADLQKEVANGFTMSIDKALEFASVYPEILNGASIAANGQISLNKEVVKSLISSKESEIKAEVDAKIVELEAKKSVLEASKIFCQAQLDLAKGVGEGEGKISKELAEYRISAGNAIAKALIENGVDEANAFKLAAAAMSQNTQEFNRIAMEVCTDVDGNFNAAAYNAAQGIYKNMQNAKTDIASVARQAQYAAMAVAGIGNGVVAGAVGVIKGSGGGTSGNKIKMSLTGSNFKGTEYSYEPKTTSLDDFIADLELDISNYSQAISQIDGQIATLKSLRSKSLDKFASESKGSGNKSKNKSSSKSKEENWFEKQYKLHNHLLNMDAENVEDYLDWLNKAYQQAYKEGIIDIDEFYKYQEEVYKGLQDLFKDYLNDIEHEISMRENYSGDNKKIIQLYKEMIAAIEKEIKTARSQGLDDTDSYIQELQSKWQSYNKSIKDIQDDIKNSAKDAVDELVDIRLDMLKQDISDEKDALKKKLDYLKDFYQKQKDLLQDAYNEEKYLEEQSEKRKAVADIQAEIAQIEYDNSAWAQKRKLELAQELSDAQKELNDFEKEHALNAAQDQLDKLYDLQEKELNKQTELLEKKESDAKALYDQALADIKNGSVSLYEEMIAWNQQYGDGIDDTIKSAWEDAYKALQDYKNLYGSLYEGVKLENATNYKPPTDSWDTEVISGTNKNNKNPQTNNSTTNSTTTNNSNINNTPSSTPSLSKGSSITVKKTATHFSAKSKNVKMKSIVPGGTYTVYNTSGNEVLIGKNGVYTGWINKSDIVGYAKGTSHATAGLHAIDEIGSETIFESKDGSKYRMFSGGEKVLNAKASDFLYKFANGSSDIIKKLIKDVFYTGMFDGVRAVVNNNEINMGDVIIQGNADKQTVSEIRRIKRESMSDLLKGFNKLNK